jgi:cysteinyl-tRNA synthetase
MSETLLGETFDIHGGGIDLVFPHHENEIAQSEGAHGGHPLAKVWMHNGFLQVEGEKMSKSLGNFVTIRQLREHWSGYGWPGEALRFNMLRTHYRDPIDWTLEGLDESHKTLWDWAGVFETGNVDTNEGPSAGVLDALRDDLNTPAVIAELHALKKRGDVEGLMASLRFLGFSANRKVLARFASRSAQFTAGGVFQPVIVASDLKLTGYPVEVTVVNSAEIKTLIEARNEARKAKNFKESDRIRDELLAKGITLKDNSDGTTTPEVKR